VEIVLSVPARDIEDVAALMDLHTRGCFPRDALQLFPGSPSQGHAFYRVSVIDDHARYLLALIQEARDGSADTLAAWQEKNAAQHELQFGGALGHSADPLAPPAEGVLEKEPPEVE
jgi:hypothetical protein